MSGTATYLWIIEWDDSFVKPQRVEVRQVTRLLGVTDEEIEQHLVEVAMPAQAAVFTRVGGVRRQLLVKMTGEHTDRTAFGSEPEGIATPLGTVGVAIGNDGLAVWNSDTGAQGDNEQD